MNFRLLFAMCASFFTFFTLVGCSHEAADDEVLGEVEAVDPFGPGVVGGKADGAGADWPSNAPLAPDCDLDPPVQVFFAPDDPTTTLELSFIDRVRDARKDFSGSLVEGENPFRIRYAVYNLTNYDIAQRLVQAKRDGVDVQVLIESDQFKNDHVEVDDIFLEAGLDVVLSDEGLDPARRVTADLIGIDAPGLMHLKIRHFEIPGWSALLTGSMNPNGSAGSNEENLNLIRDPKLMAQYMEGYEAVLHHAPLHNVWHDDRPLNVLFSPAATGERASTRMLRWLEEEKEQILLMVFSLRDVSSPAWNRSLVQVLGAKVSEGVPVVLITDRKQSDGVDMAGNQLFYDDPTEDRLRAVGVHVYEAINDASGHFDSPYPYSAMHHKAAILGRTNIRVITDASNWTAAALGSSRAKERNVETMLFIDSGRVDDNAIGHRYLGQWFRVLDRYAHQSAERDGEPPASEIREWLMSRPDWPTQPVAFEAEAQTYMGEEIFVAGDLDVLGRWTELHPGAPLRTDADTYPVWRQEQWTPMPLGTNFLWKLSAQSSTNTRWEQGRNRSGHAIPSMCSPRDKEARHSARWR